MEEDFEPIEFDIDDNFRFRILKDKKTGKFVLNIDAISEMAEKYLRMFKDQKEFQDRIDELIKKDLG